MQVTINQFLTESQILKAKRLNNAKDICKEVIEPNIDSINQKLGQENDPMYLSYAVEYVLSTLEIRNEYT